MPSVETLGQFEQLVLAAVKAIENAYAIPIQAEIQKIYPKPIKFASIYTALERLEEKGYVESRRGDPTPERKFIPKKLYTITPDGEKALRASKETAEGFLELLERKAPRGSAKKWRLQEE